MDPTSAPVNPAELYELLGIIGGVVVSGLLGLLLVRRARASRQRMIDAVGEAPAPRLGGREARTPEPEADEPEPEAAPQRPPAARKPAAPARQKEEEEERPAPEPERPPAQVIPFPAPAPARKGAALAPGLARTRSGFIARLGEVF